jgi:hypothetical protein
VLATAARIRGRPPPCIGPATTLDKGVIRASVAGHRAYCVKAGGLRMLVPLTGGKVPTRALVRVGASA